MHREPNADFLRLAAATSITYMIFDLLEWKGASLLNKPYCERRATLAALKLHGPHWDTPESIQGDFRVVLDRIGAMGLEGVVAKRVHSLYRPGERSPDWLKFKNTHRQELIIAGYERGSGRRSSSFGALLLGYYDRPPSRTGRTGTAQKLIYAGKCGTGFTQPMLNRLFSLLNARRIALPAFFNPPRGSQFVFTRPNLVGEFQFAGWTRAAQLRHGSFKGLRPDKDPSSIVRESAVS